METQENGFVWLDDLRDPKDHGFPQALWVKDPKEAIRLAQEGKIRRISFDHDLGVFDEDGKEISGAEVAKAFEEMAFHGQLQAVPQWSVHSANPEGRRRIEAAMSAAERFVAKSSGPGLGRKP